MNLVHSNRGSRPYSFTEFQAVYHQAVDDVYRFWSADMQRSLGKHNVGWLVESLDFHTYLRASDIRYFLAYEAIAATGNESLCDVGGFWGAWPLTLVRLGHKATMTESLQYFDRAFAPLFSYLNDQGVTIRDFDPFASTAAIDGVFDGVTVMAVLEHYPHSLQPFMANVCSLLAPAGVIYLEVPNLAYLPWRLKLLRGNSPLVDIGVIYYSEAPFTGHHHEFTMSELEALVAFAGLEPLEFVAFNYSHTSSGRIAIKPHHLARDLTVRYIYRRFPEAREVIAVAARLPDAEGSLS